MIQYLLYINYRAKKNTKSNAPKYKHVTDFKCSQEIIIKYEKGLLTRIKLILCTVSCNLRIVYLYRVYMHIYLYLYVHIYAKTTLLLCKEEVTDLEIVATNQRKDWQE